MTNKQPDTSNNEIPEKENDIDLTRFIIAIVAAAIFVFLAVYFL